MKITYLLIVLVFCCLLVVGHDNVNAQEAFLRKGTIAINPQDSRSLFLYIPSYTLLYNLGERRTIRSTNFNRQEEYQLATTQDGIRVLVRVPDIRLDVDTLEEYDFLVNRRMPLCETETACTNVWASFDDRGDEGDSWFAIWPRTAGKIEEEFSSGIRRVSVSVGGSLETGFIPAERQGQRLEDAGYISVLHQTYPLYRFEERNIDDLYSSCGQQELSVSRDTTRREIAAYARASLGVSVDGADGSLGIPAIVAGSVLSFLGISAGVEAVLTGNLNSQTSEESEVRFSYGSLEEQWEIKTIDIDRRADDGTYRPFATAMIRKTFECQSNQPVEMSFSSFLMTLAPLSNDEQPAVLEPIIIDSNTVAALELNDANNNRGLVSVNTQTDHGKLVDFFLGRGIPKSIANVFIKEINVARARQ